MAGEGLGAKWGAFKGESVGATRGMTEEQGIQDDRIQDDRIRQAIGGTGKKGSRKGGMS